LGLTVVGQREGGLANARVFRRPLQEENSSASVVQGSRVRPH